MNVKDLKKKSKYICLCWSFEQTRTKYSISIQHDVLYHSCFLSAYTYSYINFGLILQSSVKEGQMIRKYNELDRHKKIKYFCLKKVQLDFSKCLCKNKRKYKLSGLFSKFCQQVGYNQLIIFSKLSNSSIKHNILG